MSRAAASRPSVPRLVLDALFLVSDVPRDNLLPLLLLCVVRRNNNYLSMVNALSQQADALASFGPRSTTVFPSYSAMLATLYDLGPPRDGLLWEVAFSMIKVPHRTRVAADR